MDDHAVIDIFDATVKSWGGRLRTEALPGTLTPTFEHVREGAIQWIGIRQRKLATMPRVHFDFVDNTKVNACAFSADGHEFVGIFGGTVIMIYGLFFRMLADKAVLPAIGDPTLEMEKTPLQADWGTDFQRLVSLKADFAEPKDPVRRHYANLLAQLAIEFLLYHEYAHLANGHVALSGRLAGDPMILELGGTPSAHMPFVTQQTLEMDADCDAVSQSLARLFGRIRDVAMIQEHMRRFYQKPDDALFTWLFSTYCLFRLFGTRAFDFEAIESSSHPPAPMRQRMIFGTIDAYLEREGYKDLQDNLVTPIHNTLKEAENAFTHVTGNASQLDGLRVALSPEGGNYVSRILTHWQTIRPDLLPFARSKLAP